MKRLSVLLICVFLTGCSANTWIYDKNGDTVYHIKTTGKAVHKLKVPDFEVETDSKQDPLFKIDINGNKIDE